MSKELEEAIKSLKLFSWTIPGAFSAKEGQIISNYIDNSIPKEAIEKKLQDLEKNIR